MKLFRNKRFRIRDLGLWLILLSSPLLIIKLSAWCSETGIAPIVLQRANLLKNQTIGDEQVKELIGDVYITRGDMGIECQRAFHYQQADKIIFIDNVHYADSLRDLWGEMLIYYIEKDSLEAIGSVKVIQDIYEIRCRRAYYTKQRKEVFLEENVWLRDNNHNTLLTGKRGFGDQTLEYAKVFINANLVKKDSLDTPEITIEARMIEYFKKESSALATDSVRINKKDLNGICGKLHYDIDQQKALMEKNPVLHRETDELKGDTVCLYFQEQKLQRMEIFGNASVLSPVEGGKPAELNQMFGDQMLIEIADEQVSNITVKGKARSLYFLYEKGEAKGANNASGDKIYLEFEQGKVNKIRIAGGAEGIYYPPDYEGEVE